MKKLSVPKEVLLIGLSTILPDHIKSRKPDSDYENQLVENLYAVRMCNCDWFEVFGDGCQREGTGHV